MSEDSTGLVFDLPPITIPSEINGDTAPWIAGVAVLLLLLLVRYKPWRGLGRKLNIFRRTEKPLLKTIGWLSVLAIPVWLALIGLVFYSLWQLTSTFDVSSGAENLRWHVLAIVGMIAALGGLLGAPLMVMNAFHAERRTRAGEESYLTDRIAQAVEKLGSERVIWRNGKQNSEPNLEVRMGALYLLERIAKDSPRDHISITETMCAYIRENASSPKIDVDATHEAELRRAQSLRIDPSDLSETDLAECLTFALPRGDVQAAMTVLGRRPQDAIDLEHKEKYVLDLRGAFLDRVDITNGNFAHAILDGVSFSGATLCLASFKGARLKGANLDGADLFKTNLSEAWLSGASFVNAWLDWANLHGSQLSKASFHGANFSATEMGFAAVKSADFINAKHLDETQLAAMVGDGSTILPEQALAPRSETWTEKVLPSETFFSLWCSAKRQAGIA